MDEKRQVLSAREKAKYFTIGEFATELSRVIPYFAREQKKESVAVYPDERTIRYYMNAGIVDKPAKQGGISPAFTYRHLLQVLSIKFLQSKNYPLPKIKEILLDADEKRLEDVLLSGGDDSLKSGFTAVKSLEAPVYGRRERIRELSNSFYCEMPETEIPRGLSRRNSGSAGEQVGEWMRVEVDEGMELNVDCNSLCGSKKEKEEFLKKLAARIRIFIQNEKTMGRGKNERKS